MSEPRTAPYDTAREGRAASYDVAADGRLLMLTDTSAVEFDLVLTFFDELRRLVSSEPQPTARSCTTRGC